MTFTEAAVHVLRLVGKPLHYKEITDVAIEKDLLSHVGKSPEVTMGARLAAVVKKDAKDGVLARVKPGVFSLAEWDEETVEKGLQDRTPALKKIAERAKQEAARPAAQSGEAESAPAEPSAPESSAVSLPVPALDEVEQHEIGEDELERAELSAAATEIFEAEDDDDEPILGGDDDDGDDEVEEEGSRRRRRRRRRGGRDRDEDDLPSYTVSDASAKEASSEEPSYEEREPRRERPKLEELSGASLADSLEQALGAFRRQGSVPVKQLVESGGSGRGRSRGRSGESPSVQFAMAAVRADGLRRQAQGLRPRFRILNGGSRLALTEWGLDKELVRRERELRSQIAKYHEALQRSLLKRIGELPPRAMGELCLTLLERLGYSQFCPVRRPGSNPAEQHFSAIYSSPAGEIAAALVIRKDGRDVGRERVTELRGSLHHYGQAAVGVIVTTGQVLSGAREEAAVQGATPIHFVDGLRLAKLCEEYQIGVVRDVVTLPVPDLELFDALRAN